MPSNSDQDDDDDWAPLSPEQLALRPGECESEQVTGASDLPVAEPAPPAEGTRPVRPPNPEGERMLRELEERCARTAASDSLVAQLERRERRAARKRQLADKAAGLEEAVLRCDRTPEMVVDPSKFELDAGRHGRDPREDSDWFRGLPEHEQSRLHDAWAHRRALSTDSHAHQRRTGNRRMVAAWICAVATVVLGTGLFWHATLGAGVLTGFWWRHRSADRIMDPVRAIVSFFVMQAVVLMATDRINPGLMIDSVCVIALASLVGFDGEIRRTGGFDAVHRDLGAPAAPARPRRSQRDPSGRSRDEVEAFERDLNS